MKVGIVGAGKVGTACMFALALRAAAYEVVLVNREVRIRPGSSPGVRTA